MRTVNLIPADARRRGASLSTGVQFLGLTAVLVLALVATVLFVTAHNQVASRRAQLAQTEMSLSRWTAAAGSYAHDVAVSSSRDGAIAKVEALTAARYDWSLLLNQLGDEMPARSEISSLTVGPASGPSTVGTTSSTPVASASASSTSASANTASISMSACAASQSVVAQTMQNLRRIRGVSQVILGATSSGGSSGSSGGSSGSNGSGSCPYSWSFSLTLGFEPPSSAATAPQVQSASAPSSASTSGGDQ